MKKPLILVTNDDGILAPGIRSLISVAEKFGEVYVVAPDKGQSGMGHAITINNTIRINRFRLDDPDRNEYSCTGTPVDCIKLGANKILPRRPDLILSGINHGSNTSISVIYSGTMSAAVEGAIENIPSIGFSLCSHSMEADFGPSMFYAEKIIEHVLKHGLQPNTCLNVNIPKLHLNEIMGIKICRQAKAIWVEEFDERHDPGGKPYYWLTGYLNNPDPGTDTDEYQITNGYVAVVPIQFDMTAYKAMDGLRRLEKD